MHINAHYIFVCVLLLGPDGFTRSFSRRWQVLLRDEELRHSYADFVRSGERDCEAITGKKRNFSECAEESHNLISSSVFLLFAVSYLAAPAAEM